MDDTFNQLVIGLFLAVDEIFHQPMTRQQTLRLIEVLSQSVKFRMGRIRHSVLAIVSFSAKCGSIAETRLKWSKKSASN